MDSVAVVMGFSNLEKNVTMATCSAETDAQHSAFAKHFVQVGIRSEIRIRRQTDATPVHAQRAALLVRSVPVFNGNVFPVRNAAAEKSVQSNKEIVDFPVPKVLSVFKRVPECVFPDSQRIPVVMEYVAMENLAFPKEQEGASIVHKTASKKFRFVVMVFANREKKTSIV